MGRKSEKQYREYELELIKYQWESLRTNPEYVKEYKQLQKLSHKPKFDSWRFQPRLEYFFKKKYGIEPLDPAYPFPVKPIKIPKNRKRTEKEFLQFVLWMYFVDLIKAVHCLSPEWEKLRDTKDSDKRPASIFNKRLTPQELKNQRSILLQITLDAPLPKIITEVSEIVKDWKRKKALAGKPKDFRHRLKEYKNYFKAYKLVKNGVSWKEIAKNCYSGDYERDINYAIRKVKKDYERWKKIGFLFKEHPLLTYRMSYTFGKNPPQLLTNQEYYQYFQEHCKESINS